MTKFRTQDGRMGIIEDNNCNINHKIYCFKSPYTKKTRKEALTNEQKKFAKPLATVFLGLALLADKSNVTLKDFKSIVKRIQIFSNEGETYFSLVVGYKLPQAYLNVFQIASLRFYIGMAAFVLKVPFFIFSNYNTESPTSSWDLMHCNEAPIYDLTLKETHALIDEACKYIARPTEFCLEAIKSGSLEIETADFDSFSQLPVLATPVDNPADDSADDATNSSPDKSKKISSSAEGDASQK